MKLKPAANGVFALAITIAVIFYVAPAAGLENPFAGSIGFLANTRALLFAAAIAAAFFYLTDRYADRFEG